MIWMINSFSIKAINLLGFSATSHAGTIFPVSDTNSLGGDSAQLLSLKLWSVREVFFCRRLHKTMAVWKGNAVRCSPRGTAAEKLSHWFVSISSDGSSQQMFRQRKRMERCMGSFSQVYPCDFWQLRTVMVRDFLNWRLHSEVFFVFLK